MKITVVDDAKAVHAFLEEMFENTEIVLTHLYDGQQAVDAFASGSASADLILLDWEMPVLNGIDALPKLCVHGVPIVMMTSKNAMADIVLALNRGARDYVMKPYTKDIMLGKIEQVLGKKVA